VASGSFEIAGDPRSVKRWIDRRLITCPVNFSGLNPEWANLRELSSAPFRSGSTSLCSRPDTTPTAKVCARVAFVCGSLPPHRRARATMQATVGILRQAVEGCTEFTSCVAKRRSSSKHLYRLGDTHFRPMVNHRHADAHRVCRQTSPRFLRRA
jgi:hypothetical protein